LNLEALNHLVAHTVATLPDSLTARKQLLTDIVRLLPPKDHYRQRAMQMLAFLESHEQQQLEFTKLLTGSSL
jgi:hypothetical protein